jgi:hypothetical protein
MSQHFKILWQEVKLKKKNPVECYQADCTAGLILKVSIHFCQKNSSIEIISLKATKKRNKIF